MRKISLHSLGIFCKIAAAVSVFPCTTLVFRDFPCLLTNSAPPPFSASFLFSAPKPTTFTPARSASKIASSIFLLM